MLDTAAGGRCRVNKHGYIVEGDPLRGFVHVFHGGNKWQLIRF